MGRFCVQCSSLLQKAFGTYQNAYLRVHTTVAERRSVENILFEQFVSQVGRH